MIEKTLNERRLMQGTGTRTVSIASGKGGVGKTNLALNLALALVDLKKRVLLFDGDIGLANLDVLLGLTPRWTLEDFLEGNCTLKETLVKVEENLFLLPASSGLVKWRELSAEQIGLLGRNFTRLGFDFDWVIIDCGAGINDTVLSLFLSADDLLVVINPERAAVADAYSLMKVAGFRRSELAIKLLVNRSRRPRETQRVIKRLQAVVDRYLNCTLHLLGEVPEDSNFSAAGEKQIPFLREYPRARASNAIREVAQKLVGDSRETPARGLGAFFYRLYGSLQREVMTRGKKDSITLLGEEIETTKEVITSLHSKVTGGKIENILPPAVQSICEHMQSLGVNGVVLDDLIYKALPATGIKNEDEFLADLKERFLSSLPPIKPLQPGRARPRLIALVGPTGVGKTSTLIKLGANFSLMEGEKVAFITIDNYRMAAVEQLKNYSEVLGLAVEVVFSPQQLKEVVEKYRDKSLLLMDTPGHNPFNEETLKDLAGILKSELIDEVLLVLSMTTKGKDLIRIRERYRRFNFTGYIFTRLDETEEWGPLLNLTWRGEEYLSYLTQGQNIPEDIELIQPERLQKKFLQADES